MSDFRLLLSPSIARILSISVIDRMRFSFSRPFAEVYEIVRLKPEFSQKALLCICSLTFFCDWNFKNRYSLVIALIVGSFQSISVTEGTFSFDTLLVAKNFWKAFVTLSWADSVDRMFVTL
jgi:hypothetical protein